MAKTKSTASPKEKKPRAAKERPTHEEIALRAFHIYLERRGAPGDPMADWIRAERELTEPAKKSKRKASVISIAA
jgi:Protein of unknown function (DUF2934)